MMEIHSVADIIKKADSLTEAPEIYLSAQENAASEIRHLTKKLYDFNKINDPCGKGNNQILEELVLDNLDEEQIWQQIDLQNNFICKEFLSDIAQFLVKKNKLVFGANNFDNNDNEDEIIEDLDYDNEGEDDGEKLELSDDNVGSDDESMGGIELNTEDEGGEEEEDDENEEDDKKRKKMHTKAKPSEVDDKFFKLSEMEQFLDREENKKESDDDDDDDLIDYFENQSSDSNDEEEGPKYDDFFDQPDDGSIRKKRKKKNSENFEGISVKKKKVQFALDKNDNEDDDFDDDSSDFDNEEESNAGTEKSKNEALSTFEARQERLKSRIKALEEEALKEKPWQMKGEVKATTRPQNSLLEEYVEFDTAVRPPPVITEKTTLKLEDIIKQRIKDKVWDDVERKIKPVEDPKEFKKRLVLNQEKSKLSLAQIYEQEYLKQKQAKTESAEDKPDEVPSEHLEIDKMMKDVFSKLDALSNFHFTPKMVTTDVKIVSNLPAITVEEVTPVATSDAMLLAPEEIKSRQKGDLIGKTERTKTDKKRERRLKKKWQHIKQKELDKKNTSKPENVKDISNKTKKTSKKLMKKLGRNVTLLSQSGDGKYVKSSSAFFSKLQDEAKSLIQKKANSTKLVNDKKLDPKKLKL